MEQLQPHEKEILNSIQNINEKCVYLLLRYWHDKPLKYRRLYKKLNAIYNDKVNNDHIIAKSLDGLDWIGGDEILDEKTGDSLGFENPIHWNTNSIGKSHVKDDFFKLGYKRTKGEKLQIWIAVGTISASFTISISSSIISDSNNSDTKARIKVLEVEIDELQGTTEKLKIWVDSIVKSQTTIDDDHIEK